jgi:glycosyltransferase involved in cell wall biosynthesis
LLSFWQLFFKRKLHYAVIGGWLASYLEGKPALEKQLKKFTNIYAETSTMKHALETRGFTNVTVMPNCKELTLLQEEALKPATCAPFKLCTFSRVMQEKGIEDAVNAVKAVNEASGKTIYTLDIYGQVDANQTQWFAELQKTFPDYIRYGGLVPFDKSVEVLKDYFALLFPTRFFTEGIPGTVVDGYAAGVPVISARWESFADVIDDTVTGYGYPFGDTGALTDLLQKAAADPAMINSLKTNCLKKANDYTPDKEIAILLGEEGRVHT